MRWRAVLLAAVIATGCSKKADDPVDAAQSFDAATDLASDLATAEMGTPDAGADLAPTVDVGSECTYTPGPAESIPTPTRIHTPRWAFRPWISKDISDAADTYAFVDGFAARDIPVGTVVLDSPWETNYNTFVPNPDRYPDFGQMVADLRARDVRLVLWVTQLTNEISFDLEQGGDLYTGPAPNYVEGLACDFFIDDGRGFTWWKGRGASVDFYNPVARQWWHEQQDPLLELGVAGWKLDFGDSYVRSDTVETAAGQVAHQDYSEAYYRDFYEYGIDRLGHDEFVTMVRAYDKSYDFEGRFYARPEHAPVVWVGDNRRDWVGLADALDHTFRSAAAGYVVIGSDLGGYLNRDDEDLGVTIPFDRTNFLRWLAHSAMTPFMQIHGRANLTPWTLPDDMDVDESVAVYRYWSHLHTELVPFWYGLAEESYAGNQSGIIRPIGDEASWGGDYRYMLGDAFLVAPILDATGVRDVEVPDGLFYDWWTEQPVIGPATVSYDYSADLQRLPLLVKAGAIVPIESSTDATGMTAGGLSAADVVLAWPTVPGSSFVSHDENELTTTFTVVDDPGQVVFTASRATKPLVVRVRFEDPVTAVTVDGVPATLVTDEAGLLAGPAYRVDTPYVWVSAGARDQPIEIHVSK